MIGTPAYVSPEQATGDRALDARSDIYSLGCVLSELLVGKPPFTGASAQAVITKRFIDTAPSVRRLRATVPLAVDRAIAKALERTPADRFSSATMFAEARLRPGTTARIYGMKGSYAFAPLRSHPRFTALLKRMNLA